MRPTPRRWVCSWLAAAAFAAVGPVHAAEKVTEQAAEPKRAGGWFQSTGARLGIADAYAFHGTATLGDEKVIVVAVSNQGFVPSVIDRYWNRRFVLEHFFKDDQTGLVYFEFGLDGRYRGLSYYFGSGDGCGYCSGGVESTVKLVDGRLRGTLHQAEGSDKRSFDVTLDVPVEGDDHGTTQGAGGGAPGQAYLAYDRALGGSDPAAVRSCLSEERRATWAHAEKQGQGSEFLAFLREDHPTRIAVTQGYIDGDHALVLFEGENAEGKLRGEAQLVREGGSWRFEEETLEPLAD